MDGICLTAAERRRLERQLHTTEDARLYRRTLAILEVAGGRPIAEVAASLQVDRRSIFRWLEAYRRQRDPEALGDRPGRGRKSLWDEEHRAFLNSLMEDSPQDLGYEATQWTVPLLGQHLNRCNLPPCSPATLRRRIHDLGLVWKRPRYVLQEDPEKEKKTTHPQASVVPAPPQCGAFRG